MNNIEKIEVYRRNQNLETEYLELKIPEGIDCYEEIRREQGFEKFEIFHPFYSLERFDKAIELYCYRDHKLKIIIIEVWDWNHCILEFCFYTDNDLFHFLCNCAEMKNNLLNFEKIESQFEAK